MRQNAPPWDGLRFPGARLTAHLRSALKSLWLPASASHVRNVTNDALYSAPWELL
jgi:hypothetical protein